MGDCVLAKEGGGRTSLGPDDYRSDLDAANISAAAFEGGISYQEAAWGYYEDLDSGAYTRADKFLENSGGYDNVVDQVYANLAIADTAALIRGKAFLEGPDILEAVYVPSPDREGAYEIVLVDHTVPEQLEIIGRQEELGDTRRFLDALRDGKNELD